METKELTKELTVEEIQKQAMDNVIKIAQAEATKAVEGVAKQSEVEAVKAELAKEIALVSAEVKKQSQISKDEVVINYTLDQAISKAIGENAEMLQEFKGDKRIALKAVVSGSWANASLTNQTTDVRRSLYNSPYSPLYLRNIFPNVSTNSASVIIPQASSVTGAAAVWARGTGAQGADVEKPEVSPTYTDVTVPIKWLAGFTTVNRELLMNVNYLQGSITNTLLYGAKGLYAAENKMITDYIVANKTAYSGSATVAVEKIIDAAFNQLLANYKAPTHVLMNPGDYLQYIKLNKASGSGEYDLPNDLLRGFSGTGLETSVQIVPVPTLDAGKAYVISAPEFEFISRMQPELQIAEQHSNDFTYNRVTFRVEEMAGFVCKDLTAIVEVVL